MTTFLANGHQRGLAALEDPIVNKALPLRRSRKVSTRYTKTGTAQRSRSSRRQAAMVGDAEPCLQALHCGRHGSSSGHQRDRSNCSAGAGTLIEVHLWFVELVSTRFPAREPFGIGASGRT
jgi:hypothetical protein